MKLLYKAVAQDGTIARGVIDARDQKEAASYLRQQQLHPIKIIQRSERSFLGSLPFIRKHNASDLIFFTRQLASMLSSGLTLMQSLGILREQVQNKYMAELINSIIVSIEDGKSFASSIERYPDVFSSTYVALISAAESSGVLDKVMMRLADNLEKQQKLKNTIASAMIYPAIIFVAMGAVIFIMMVFVIPQLTKLFTDQNLVLPLPTQIIIGFSNLVVGYSFYILILVVIGIFLFHRWHKTSFGRMTVDTALLRIPLLGKVLSESMMIELSRTLGLLVGTGALVVDSLVKTADVMNNVVYKNAVITVARQVEKGISVGDALGANPVFPPMLVEMVKIGEQTGKLDESLTRVSEYFDREVEQSVKGLTAAFEPMIMIVLGICVAFLLIAVITPIYKLTSSF